MPDSWQMASKVGAKVLPPVRIKPAITVVALLAATGLAWGQGKTTGLQSTQQPATMYAPDREIRFAEGTVKIDASTLPKPPPADPWIDWLKAVVLPTAIPLIVIWITQAKAQENLRAQLNASEENQRKALKAAEDNLDRTLAANKESQDRAIENSKDESARKQEFEEAARRREIWAKEHERRAEDLVQTIVSVLDLMSNESLSSVKIDVMKPPAHPTEGDVEEYRAQKAKAIETAYIGAAELYGPILVSAERYGKMPKALDLPYVYLSEAMNHILVNGFTDMVSNGKGLGTLNDAQLIGDLRRLRDYEEELRLAIQTQDQPPSNPPDLKVLEGSNILALKEKVHQFIQLHNAPDKAI
ncbi:hypothetical protein BH11ARM2_BH11ARM2_36840 [soil metagenome]